MSATNRGGTRDRLDRYYTPDDVTDYLVRLIAHRVPDGAQVLEPSVGGGAFARAVKRHCCCFVSGMDIDPHAEGFRAVETYVIGDFAAGDPGRWDAVIGNPPYRDAQSHVEQAIKAAPFAAFLLRLAFLESMKRHEWWRGHQPSDVYVLSKRPSFTGGGTDSAAYGWFVWDASHDGPTRLHVVGPGGEVAW